MKLKDFYHNHPRFIWYAAIGIVSTGLEFLIYAVLCRYIPYLYANVIGFHCGILCSFLLNRKYNFKKEDKTVLRLTSFYLIQIICLAINSLILYLCVDIAGWNQLIAKGISIALTAFLPFFLNKHITFGKIF